MWMVKYGTLEEGKMVQRVILEAVNV